MGYTHCCWAVILVYYRFIPTRVGYTNYPRGILGFKTVHPHSRGVYDCRSGKVPGSPPVHPHSRGVYRPPGAFLRVLNRFIPTRVGYTCCYRSAASLQGWFIPTRVGYTFPEWGKVHNFMRFIPTRVGYTRGLSSLPPPVPRFIPTRVGYTPTSEDYNGSDYGSSPLAWGILFDSRSCCPRLRFIPTRVGYTPQNAQNGHTGAVHPHSRGVYGCLRLSYMARPRFIPTRVGYTYLIAKEKFKPDGSSPLAWGIL